MIHIDYKDNRPFYEQVTEKLEELMVLGVLEEDTQLPSVRNLALELSINPNTIQRAYSELERQGFIYSVKGKGSFVGNMEKIRAAKKHELISRMGEIAREAGMLGLSKEEFLEYATQQYIGGKADDTGKQPDEKV